LGSGRGKERGCCFEFASKVQICWGPMKKRGKGRGFGSGGLKTKTGRANYKEQESAREKHYLVWGNQDTDYRPRGKGGETGEEEQ